MRCSSNAETDCGEGTSFISLKYGESYAVDDVKVMCREELVEVV